MFGRYHVPHTAKHSQLTKLFFSAFRKFRRLSLSQLPQSSQHQQFLQVPFCQGEPFCSTRRLHSMTIYEKMFAKVSGASIFDNRYISHNYDIPEVMANANPLSLLLLPSLLCSTVCQHCVPQMLTAIGDRRPPQSVKLKLKGKTGYQSKISDWNPRKKTV